VSRTPAQRLIPHDLKLPTLPRVAERVVALADDPEASAREIGDAILADAPIAMKVLKIANSAYYGLQEEVVSTERAASILGFRVLRNIVLQATVIAEFEHLAARDALDLDRLWRHSILTGRVCAWLAARAGQWIGLAPDELHVVGLLHDVGKVVLLDQDTDAYVAALRDSKSSGRQLFVCERSRFGCDHTDVGAILCARWNLPDAVARAVQFHHGPREAVASDPLVCLVANVNLMLERLVEDEDLEAARATIDPASTRIIGIEETDVEEAIDFAVAEASRIQI